MMSQKTEKITSQIDVVVRFQIEVPMIATEENASEVSESAFKLIREKIKGAFKELHEHFTIEVS